MIYEESSKLRRENPWFTDLEGKRFHLVLGEKPRFHEFPSPILETRISDSKEDSFDRRSSRRPMKIRAWRFAAGERRAAPNYFQPGLSPRGWRSRRGGAACARAVGARERGTFVQAKDRGTAAAAAAAAETRVANRSILRNVASWRDYSKFPLSAPEVSSAYRHSR